MTSIIFTRKLLLPITRNIFLKNKESNFIFLTNKVMGSSSTNGFDVYNEQNKPEYKFKVEKNDLKNRLSSIQYYVTQEKGTERPFSGEYVYEKRNGVFACIVCNEELFDSKAKFDSGCGWPSFSDVVNLKKVLFLDDRSHGMKRIEVQCANCGAHMGHVFDDGPGPTNVRYCINSASIKFNKKN